MDIFDLFTMLGGLAMFLYGMSVMGDGLSRASGGKLESVLERMTSSTLKGILLGTGVTALIQSSSATTVMVVGFVNSGIMKLERAAGIIMGANVGTTITAWLLSLSGIQGNSFWVRIFKPASFAPLLALLGTVLLLFTKNGRKRDAGAILMGFALLMTGMDTMSGAVKPLADVPAFTGLFLLFANPVLGMLAGLILTAVMQSSSASVGILQALCATGAVSCGAAIPIILGQNIGTCVTALLSSVGAKKNAKRAAFVHLYFNLISTVVLMAVFYTLNAFLHFGFLSAAVSPAWIAGIHSAFNIIAVIGWLPFHPFLVKLARWTVPGGKRKKSSGEEKAQTEKMPRRIRNEQRMQKALRILDERFLDTPGLAVEQGRIVFDSMASLTAEAIEAAIGLLQAYDGEQFDLVATNEELVDLCEDQLSSYLLKLAGKELLTRDSQMLSVLLHSVGDLERISDHAMSIARTAEEIFEKGLNFSREAMQELEIFSEAVREVVNTAMEALREADPALAKEVQPLDETIRDIGSEVKRRHVNRLREGRCTVEMGFMLSDLVTAYKRVSDHCSGAAVCLIQAGSNEYRRHAYLDSLRHEGNEAFRLKYRAYREKYALPQFTGESAKSEGTRNIPDPQ